MRRFATVAVVLAAVCGVLVTVPATAETCIDGHSWKYCGEHWRGSELPLKFRVNLGTAPNSLSPNGIKAAIRGAAFEWDRHWPLRDGSITINPAKQPGDCGYAEHAVCYLGTTGAGLDTGDGINTILWGPPSACDPTLPADAVAVACFAYDGTASPWFLPAGKRIREVDILLNPAKTWRIPNPQEVALGEAIGAFPPVEGPISDFVTNMFWFDVQSVLAHEIGHALGLEHVGATSPWPENLEDTDRYTQTMYRHYYRGSTNKRTLDYGDIVGLQRVALDTFADD